MHGGSTLAPSASPSSCVAIANRQVGSGASEPGTSCTSSWRRSRTHCTQAVTCGQSARLARQCTPSAAAAVVRASNARSAARTATAAARSAATCGGAPSRASATGASSCFGPRNRHHRHNTNDCAPRDQFADSRSRSSVSSSRRQRPPSGAQAPSRCTPAAAVCCSSASSARQSGARNHAAGGSCGVRNNRHSATSNGH